MTTIEVGDPAPDFTATASDGRRVSLSDFKGTQTVVIFFYPSDNTAICTQEACSFRDAYADFAKLNATVIGVSGDSNESHRQFAAAKNLPYTMIADEDGSLRQLFGVPKILYVVPSRVTFVIDRNGIVRSKFSSLLLGTKHVEEALKTVRELA